MTSTSSAAIDRTSDSTAQPEDPPRRDSQLPENNDGSASIPAVSDENRAKNEKINFQGETRGSQFTTAQDEQNTEKYEEGLDDFGLPIRVRAQPDRPTEDFSTGNKTSHDVQEVSHGPDDDARLKAQEGEETSKPDHPNEPEKEHQDTARKLEKSPLTQPRGIKQHLCRLKRHHRRKMKHLKNSMSQQRIKSQHLPLHLHQVLNNQTHHMT